MMSPATFPKKRTGEIYHNHATSKINHRHRLLVYQFSLMNYYFHIIIYILKVCRFSLVLARQFKSMTNSCCNHAWTMHSGLPHAHTLACMTRILWLPYAMNLAHIGTSMTRLCPHMAKRHIWIFCVFEIFHFEV